MGDGDQWIVIERWDDFQHPDVTRSRNVPPWIKAYTKLLADDAFLELSHHQRGVLFGLWLEYARSTRQLRDSTVAITRRLGQRVTRRDLEALNHAGFITFSASKPLADCLQLAGLDKRREENPPTPLSASPAKPPQRPKPTPRTKGDEPTHEQANPHTCNTAGCTIRFPTEHRLAEHRENVHGLQPATIQDTPHDQPDHDDTYLDSIAPTTDNELFA